ncbi:MAG: hypothetical protein A2Z52_00835, partial [Candidatus Moranbacteria bacterium RBG_19FT_COMBO_42_6]
TTFTTPSSWRLQKHLREAVKAGCEYAIVEVTSHALDQNRVWGVDFDVAVITNVTREHLDYHKTIEEYAKIKERLFKMVSKNPKGISVVNLGMDKPDVFLNYEVKEKYGYGIKVQSSKFKVQSDSLKLKIVEAESIKLDIHNSQFTIHNSQFTLNLPGEFNVENALAATCVGLSQGISLEKISEALAKIKGIPGRMERIENNKGIEIIVDYAVTPDSLEKLYDYINQMRSSSHPTPASRDLPSGRGGRIIAVFGACGERDRGKRPIMGKIVGKAADYVFVTNEDPYNEDPQQIINEVFAGVVTPPPTSPLYQGGEDKGGLKTEGINAFRILDRHEAIKKALEMARAGDIVVVTGKGAEETMAIGAERIPWNDPKVIREVLGELEK